MASNRGSDFVRSPRAKGAGDSLFKQRRTHVSDVSKPLARMIQWLLGMSVSGLISTIRPPGPTGHDFHPQYLYRQRRQRKFTGDRTRNRPPPSMKNGSEQAARGIAIGDYLPNRLTSVYVTNFTLTSTDDPFARGEVNFSDVSYSLLGRRPTFRCRGF